MRFRKRYTLLATLCACLGGLLPQAFADETCNSPYMSNLIKGQEDFVHVWTLGVEGPGRWFGQARDRRRQPDVEDLRQGARTRSRWAGAAKRTTWASPTTASILWAGGLDDSKIYVFDVGTDPAKPKLVQTIADLPAKTKFVGPAHLLRAARPHAHRQPLERRRTRAASPAWPCTTTRARSSRSTPMPTGDVGGVKGDGYGYDIAVNPAKNVLLTSSFAGCAELHARARRADQGRRGDEALRQHHGRVGPEVHAAARRCLSVPGAPLEIRWSLAPGQNWAITAAALTSKLWLVKQDAEGTWAAKEVATIGDPAKIPLPVDISITRGRQGPVGQHLHGRHHALLRPLRSRAAEADLLRSTPASRST